MPLLDHFHAPLAPRRHWDSFHVNWAGAIADALNEQLPTGYFAEEHAQPASLAVGKNLPLLPLALNAEICLPLDLEASYSTACQRRRLP